MQTRRESTGLNEKGSFDSPAPNCEPRPLIIGVDPRYFRPTEVKTLLGNRSEARHKLGWTPKIRCDESVAKMV
jgi:GDPmannose 4,6-dehydratase